jgi:polyisoprenoid-binding protein YceI
MVRPIIAFAALTLLFTGCAKDPSKDAPAAKVSEPSMTKATPLETTKAPPKPEAPAAKPDPATTTSTAVEPKPTSPGHVKLGGRVGFVGSKVTGSHECMFRTWNGTAIKGANAGQWGLKIEIDVNSVFCDGTERTEWSEKLDAHLRSGDFFDVPNHPKATFESTEMRAELEGEYTHVVKGNLTIRGKTKEVSFPMTAQFGEKRVTGKAEFSINRKDFGIEYPGKPDDLIREGVVLKLQLSGSRI